MGQEELGWVSGVGDSFLFFKINLFIYFYFWLCWVLVAAHTFFSCGEWGLLFIVVCRHLIAVASLVVEHGL